MRAWQWTGYALATVLGVSVVAFAPLWYAAQMFLVVMVATPILVAVGSRANQMSWRSFAGPILLASLAWATATGIERFSEYSAVVSWAAPALPPTALDTGTVHSPTMPDYLHLIGHPLAAFGTLLNVRDRRAGRKDLEGFLDAALVTIALTCVVTATLARPIFQADLPWSTRATLLAYPVADLVILAGLARMAVMPSRWTPSFVLVGFSAVFVVAGDMANSGLLLQRHQVIRFSHGAYLLAALALCVAITHRSIRRLPEPVVADLKPFSVGRVVSLCSSMLVAPAVLVIQGLRGQADPIAFLLFSSATIVLVALRTGLMVRALERRTLLLRRLARTDYLTGVPNRRTLDAELERSVARARESGQRLTIALIDLDHFKAYNDTYGHQAGDRLLALAVGSWQVHLPDGAVLGRFGGEEFLLICDEAPARLSHRLDRMRADTPAGQTFSAGLAGLDRTEQPADLIARADRALYDAKAGGRARSCVAAAASNLRLPRPVVSR